MDNKLKKVIKKAILLFKTKNYIPISKPIYYSYLLENKVALITGGSSGIGYAIAQKFIEHGCKVIISGRNEEKLKKCCDSLGEDCKYIVMDVTDISKIESKVVKASEMFDNGKIDILVNSAGVVAHSDFYNMTEKEYDTIMNTNAKGTFFISQAVSKLMINLGIKGHILNVTSSSALRPAWTPYQMSKWAVRGFTLGLADTLLPHGIIVNAIAPGPVATPMLGKDSNDNIYMNDQPSGRFAMPEEIASLAVFMVSDMADLVVGDTFYITGGSGTITLHN